MASPQQQAELDRRWAGNPYSYIDLFQSRTTAVPVEQLIAYLAGHGLSRTIAIGWLATMTQTGRLEMISLDLVRLGPRASLPPVRPAD